MKPDETVVEMRRRLAATPERVFAAFAEDIVADIRAALAGAGTLTEVKMFGGIGFMLDGNMVAAVSKRGLLLRVGKERYAQALAQPDARPVQMRGREIEGYVRVDPNGLSKVTIESWLAKAVAFVRTLPPKQAEAKPNRKGPRK